jgi:hypothetical protein
MRFRIARRLVCRSDVLEEVLDTYIVEAENLLFQGADLSLQTSSGLDEFVIVGVFELAHGPVVCV